MHAADCKFLSRLFKAVFLSLVFVLSQAQTLW
jgi:hypothetical protein